MIIRISKPKIPTFRPEWLLNLSMILYVTSSTWINFLSFLPISNVWVVSAMIYALMMGYCYLKRTLPSIHSILIITISVILFAIAYYSAPENSYYFTRETYGLSRVFRPDRTIYFVLLISLYRNNPKELLKALWMSSLVLSFFGGIEFIQATRRGFWLEYNYAGKLTNFSYSLAFGYKMILPCLVFLYSYIKNKNLGNLILLIMTVGMIIVGGSRGQLLCIAAFLCIMIYRLYKNTNSIYKYFLIASIIIFSVIFTVLDIQAILLSIISHLEKMGISSRTLTSIISGSFTNDNSRFVIWDRAINAIKNGGFFGYGVYGDRPIISSLHYAGYCHNIFLELMISFGASIGFVLSVFIVLRSFYIINIPYDDLWIDIFVIMFSVSVQLLISMSFWYVMSFWGALECSHYCKKQKNKRISIRL